MTYETLSFFTEIPIVKVPVGISDTPLNALHVDNLADNHGAVVTLTRLNLPH